MWWSGRIKSTSLILLSYYSYTTLVLNMSYPYIAIQVNELILNGLYTLLWYFRYCYTCKFVISIFW